MKLKLKQGGIVKLQTAWTTIPNINETILRTWDKQSEAERKEAERQMKLAEQQRMYNRLHGLPENTVFIPTNGGTISETGPLYSNGLERYLDQTAKGQEMVRMADTAKKSAGIALAAAGGNWLMNGLKVAPLLTGLEFVGGGAAGAALKPVGDWMDKTFHTKNQILDFGTALPFVGMIGGAKGAKWLGENKTFRGAIEGFNQRVHNMPFIPADIKYYGPTMGKSYAAKTNPNLIDLDTWGRPEYDQLAKKYGYKDWREMILSDKGDYNKEYKALIKDQIKRIQSNPKYSGKTIVVSNASLLNPDSGITFANTPTIPERNIMAQRNNTRHPWESIEHGEQWWDSLQAKGAPLKIDNRFISEIEGNKVISLPEFPVNPQEVATTYHLDGTMPMSRPISEAERLGIPKSMRSNPKALEDPYYWGYKQWNQKYFDALNRGDYPEVQRIRDLHFKVKAPNTKVVDENGMPLHMYHGTGIDVFNNYKPNRFTRYEGVNWDLEDAVDSGVKENHWKLSIPNDDRMTSYHTPNKNIAKNYFGVLHDDYLNIKNPIKWDESSLKKITGRDYISDWADFRAGKKELMQQGYDGLFIPQYYNSYGAFVSPSQFKSAEPITWNGKGEIISIVKRDNFHNLDRRYKQGGIVKAQDEKINK